MALLTKLDYSLFLPIVIIILGQRKNSFKNMAVFMPIVAGVILVVLNYFGIGSIINSVLSLREKASAIFAFEPLKIFGLLKNEVLLLLLTIFNFAIFFIKKINKKDYFTIALYSWFFSSFLMLFVFRPLFQHHLVFLAVPSALLLGNYLSTMNASINPLRRSFSEASQLIGTSVIVVFISLVSFMNNFQQINKRQKSAKTEDRQVARNFIFKYSEENDFIITDESALYGMTGRLPPPELADLSLVQIQSGNVDLERIKATLKKYKPKMILIWSDKLIRVKNLEKNLEEYQIVYSLKNRKIYVLDE